MTGNHRNSVDVSKPMVNRGTRQNEIVHINGYIDYIDERNLLTSTKLTSESYSDVNFLKSPWTTEFELDVERSKSIFFIGFSLDYDLDIKRIVAADKKNIEKIYFINGPHMSPIVKNTLEKFGNVVEITGEDFSDLVEKRFEEFVPRSDKEIRTFSLIPPKIPSDKTIVKDQEIADLFFNGKADEEKIYNNIHKSEYVIHREEIDSLLNELERNELIVFHSKLGNGKTILLKSIEGLLLKEGLKFYSYNGKISNVREDIEAIENISEPTYIIIDDYYSLKSQFKYFSRLSKSNFKFIISGRTTINDNNLSDFISKAGFEREKVIMKNLDAIANNEIVKLYELITTHNLWGGKAADSKSEKMKYLKQISKKGFQNIVLEIVKSNNIITKLGNLVEELDRQQKEIVFGVLINNILRSSLELKQLLKITDNNSVGYNVFNDEALKEFVDISNNSIVLRSSVASKELLYLENDKQFITGLMKKMLQKADEIDLDKTYEYFKREIISFSNFKLLLFNINESELNNLAVDYYEGIRNESFNKDNPFFWLQYGIQKINEKQYDLATVFLANAHSYAGKRGMTDFYQINAQKARAIVERLIEEKTDVNAAFAKFEEAHNLLVSDLNKKENNKSYQLGQGYLYMQFYQNYYDSLDENKKSIFILMLHIFEQHINDYIDQLEVKGVEMKMKIKNSKRYVSDLSKKISREVTSI